MGQVWLPSKRIVLGSDAGVWVHKVMKMTAHQAFRKDKDLKWRRSAETSPLLEIALFLRHKSQKARKMSFAKRLFCAGAEGPQHQAWPRDQFIQTLRPKQPFLKKSSVSMCGCCVSFSGPCRRVDRKDRPSLSTTCGMVAHVPLLPVVWSNLILQLRKQKTRRMSNACLEAAICILNMRCAYLFRYFYITRPSICFFETFWL